MADTKWVENVIQLTANTVYEYNCHPSCNILMIRNKSLTNTIYMDTRQGLTSVNYETFAAVDGWGFIIRPNLFDKVFLLATANISNVIVRELTTENPLFLIQQMAKPPANDVNVITTVGLKTADLNIDGDKDLQVDVKTLPNVTVGAALPAGTNNIGDVDVLTLPALPAGTNNIGKVSIEQGGNVAAVNASGELLVNASGVTLTATSVALQDGVTASQKASINASGQLAVQVAAALPAGTNNIGDVDVLTLPALPAGTNNIGDVDVLTLPALPAGTNNIGDVDVLTLPALPAGTNNIGKITVESLDEEILIVEANQTSPVNNGASEVTTFTPGAGEQWEILGLQTESPATTGGVSGIHYFQIYAQEGSAQMYMLEFQNAYNVGINYAWGYIRTSDTTNDKPPDRTTQFNIVRGMVIDENTVLKVSYSNQAGAQVTQTRYIRLMYKRKKVV